MKTADGRPIHASSGSILVTAMLLLLALGGLSATLSVLNLRLHREHEHAREELRAFCVAEAGVNEAYAVLQESSVTGVRALEYPRSTSAGSYQVELLDGRDDAEIDLDRIRLRSAGEAGRAPEGVQLMVWHVPTGLFRFALFGSRGVRLNSNVTVDSFDPDDGPYPDRVEYVNDFGHVGSFESIGIDANVSIYGNALVGPDGVFDDGAPNILVSGEQEAVEIDEEMPVITVPAFPSKGSLLTTTMTLPAGDHHYRSLTLTKGTLTVQGPARLVVDSFAMLSGTNLVIDNTNGPVELYATGNFVLRSSSSILTRSGNATDFAVYITSDNVTGPATIELRSNAEFNGTIYAPNARIRLASNFEVFGAVKAALVELASNTRIHYDENLLYDPEAPDVFELVSWRRLSQEEIRAVEAGGARP
jgi:hypothetical protein